jgi:RimJ/RimL family protein N-acetyltransferase
VTAIGPTLETARLILRPPIAADFEAWADFQADEEAVRYIGGVQARAICWRTITSMTGAWALFGFSMFSVVEKESGRWIGRLGPWAPEGWPGTEVGWGLARAYWGRGYAAEGAAAAIDWAFDTLGWTEVIHTIVPANANSIKLATRLGSSRRGEGMLPPPVNLPIDIYGQTRAQWRNRRRT